MATDYRMGISVMGSISEDYQISPRIAGFRAVDAISDEKIDPIPTPAPISPIAARPAPINFAAAIILYIYCC